MKATLTDRIRAAPAQRFIADPMIWTVGDYDIDELRTAGKGV